MTFRGLIFGALLTLAIGCDGGRSVPPGEPGNQRRDAGQQGDSGTIENDAGFDDSGAPIDTGVEPQDTGVEPADSGVDPIDSGELDMGSVDLGVPDPIDTGVRPDSGVPPDSGVRPDSGVFPDAGPPGDGGVSTGCGTPQTSGVFNANITVNGTRRTLVLVVPANYDPNRMYPLIFGFHGSSWLGSSYRNQLMPIENAAAGNAIFVWPDGLPVGGGQTGWDLSPSGRDVAFFDALLNGLAAQYCVDMSRVFAFGSSFGGFFTNTLGCARPARLRGIGSIAGGGPSFTCAGPTSFWGAHAQDDATVGYSNGTRSRDTWRNLNQCSTNTTPTTPSPCYQYTGCANGRKVEWCGRQSGGHIEPPYAGSALWAFFMSL